MEAGTERTEVITARSDSVTVADPEAPGPSRWSHSGLGIIALGLAVLGVGFSVVGIALASPATATETAWVVATVLAYIADGLTVAGALLGVVALVLGRGRRLAVAAIVVGVLGNPFLQVTVFALLG